MNAITWNDNLVPDELHQNKRLVRIGVIMAPIYLAGLLADAAFIKHVGDGADVPGVITFGLVAPAVFVVLSIISGTSRLRMLRKIPIVTISETEIRIGAVTIQQSVIRYVETGIRGRNLRRFKIHLQDGSTKLLRVPREISIDAVRALFRISPTLTDRNLMFPP